ARHLEGLEHRALDGAAAHGTHGGAVGAQEKAGGGLAGRGAGGGHDGRERAARASAAVPVQHLKHGLDHFSQALAASASMTFSAYTTSLRARRRPRVSASF